MDGAQAGTAGTSPAPRIRALGAALAAAALLALAAFLWAVDPSATRILPGCPFHSLTGLHCPGCGSTRAVHQLLHGRVATAFGLNPFLVLALPFLAWGAASAFLEFAAGRRLPGVVLPAFWIHALLAALLLFTVLRNLPFHPFTLLAP
ncbi:MAG: DUF2752 domain-containing protein [Planctomycetes bacterium]|jgi:hypothetical protein|nr:DUF2752 domain-containing protein [Planctomycetota bacterium]